jgi:Ca2+-binding RTX toxin-like protein
MAGKSSSPFRPQLETLETRVLPAAGISFREDVVTVRGTNQDDKCVIAQRDDAVVVRLSAGGKQVRRKFTDVDHIVFLGGGGDDRCVNNSELPLEARAGRGNDFVVGGQSDDFLDGGPGDDTLIGDDGDDMLIGGPGNDRLSGDDGDDTLSGGPGNNVLAGGDGDNLLISINPDDRLSGQAEEFEDSEPEPFDPTTEADADVAEAPLPFRLVLPTPTIELTGGQLIIRGTIFSDTARVTVLGREPGALLVATIGGVSKTLPLNAVAGIQFYGYSGNDVFVNASNVPAVAYGGDGNDSLTGGGGADKLYGEAGNDTLVGNAGNDVLSGQDGSDSLDGGLGFDYLFGGNDNDTLNGGNDDDKLYGGKGDDKIYGGNGNDTLFGGPGTDVLNGGTGTNLLFQEDLLVPRP